MGVRGPYGGRYISTLPAGAVHYPWHGNDYWHVGFGWWNPCWIGDDVHYNWVYPPTGYYYPDLPDDYSTVVVNNTTYYESEGVYYQDGEQEGKKGYVVAEVPPGVATEDAAGENPYKILKDMSDYLGGLDKFGVLVETTTDQPRSSGDTVQISARRNLYVQRPNKLAVEVTSDTGQKKIVYDGKTASMFDRTKNLYTVVQVPNTIETALDSLARDYGAVIPCGDFLYKDLYGKVEPRLATGQYLGLHTVDNINCHHLAFTTESASCEIWIDAGEKPIPRKIAVDSNQGGTRSRYNATVVRWTDSPSFTAETFEFKVPDDAKRFEMASNRKDSTQ